MHRTIRQSPNFRDGAAKPAQSAAILRAARMIFSQRRKPARGGGAARFAEFWPDFQRAAPGLHHAGSSGLVRGHRMVHHPGGAHPEGDGRPYLHDRREIPAREHHPDDVPLPPYRVGMRGAGEDTRLSRSPLALTNLVTVPHLRRDALFGGSAASRDGCAAPPSGMPWSSRSCRHRRSGRGSYRNPARQRRNTRPPEVG